MASRIESSGVNEFTDVGFNVTLGITNPIGTSINNSFTITGLIRSGTYRFMLVAVDDDGYIGPLSGMGEIGGGMCFDDGTGHASQDPACAPPAPPVCTGINSDPNCEFASPEEERDILNSILNGCMWNTFFCPVSDHPNWGGGGPWVAWNPGGATMIADGTAQSVSSDPNAIFIRPAEGSLTLKAYATMAWTTITMV